MQAARRVTFSYKSVQSSHLISISNHAGSVILYELQLSKPCYWILVRHMPFRLDPSRPSCISLMPSIRHSFLRLLARIGPDRVQLLTDTYQLATSISQVPSVTLRSPIGSLVNDCHAHRLRVALTPSLTLQSVLTFLHQPNFVRGPQTVFSFNQGSIPWYLVT